MGNFASRQRLDLACSPRSSHSAEFPELQKKREGAFAPSLFCIQQYPHYSASRFLTMVGSTLMPGPIVVETATDLMYLPFAVAGLTRTISEIRAW